MVQVPRGDAAAATSGGLPDPGARSTRAAHRRAPCHRRQGLLIFLAISLQFVQLVSSRLTPTLAHAF